MRTATWIPLALAAAACGSPGGGDAGADLVPVKPHEIDGPVGWCDTSDGRLRVTVKNLGPLGTPKTGVKVTFHHAAGPPGETAVTVPALPGGASHTVLVDVPDPVPAGDTTFTIHVDAKDDVVETDETNNVAHGRCNT